MSLPLHDIRGNFRVLSVPVSTIGDGATRLSNEPTKRGLPGPATLPYDVFDARDQPRTNRLQLACRAWAMQGYGAPAIIYVLYVFKIALYIGGWLFFCSFSQSLTELGGWYEHASTATAFQKAILWSMLFEVMGFGCGSGPLTGRYLPPFGACLHFARPGTVKLPLFPRIPGFGRGTRSWIGAGLYLVFLGCLIRALCAPSLVAAQYWPVVVLLPILALMDKTIFLAARGEHYYVMTVCFLFNNDWIAGAIAVQSALWLWAAVSKLTPNFPSVVCTMVSNSPILRWKALRKRLYRAYPTDLRPARLTVFMAHFGTLVEFVFPLLLIFGGGGPMTTAGLVIMLAFHGYITANFPIAVPIEWNVMMVYGGLFLFGVHPESTLFSLASPVLGSILFVSVFLLPLLGNLKPAWVSFLVSMRYYAGNWPFSIWFFRGDSVQKLDSHLIKCSRHPRDQLLSLYDERVVEGSMQLVAAFRAMHLHGRVLHALIPKAVEHESDYVYHDGEMVAGLVLGWNFGDGHLHNESLMGTIQEKCGFEAGELRCIFVEALPLFGRGYRWRIHDAATGLLESGETSVASILDEQPWPSAQRD